jgi:error-prone DNA polymerase
MGLESRAMAQMSEPPLYAELVVTTNFSFLRGASHPGEMVGQAAELGLHAIGIADRNTVAGIVRAHAEVKRRKAAGEPGIRFLPGVRLVTQEGFEAVAYPMDRAAYGRLCRLLTLGNRRSEKGQCRFDFSEFLDASEGQMLIAVPPEDLAAGDPFLRHLEALAAHALPAGSPWRGAIAGAATSAAASGAWPNGARASARPWWRSPTRSTTTRTGAPCRTSSPASARAAPWRRRATVWRPMPSAT